MFKAHKLLLHSTLGSKVIKKKKKNLVREAVKLDDGTHGVAVPRRARVQGSQTFVSLNSRPESNKEEQEGVQDTVCLSLCGPANLVTHSSKADVRGLSVFFLNSPKILQHNLK